MADRAQSEALGFVLVFALVIGAMSALTVAGVAGLQDVRDAERATSAERALDLLAEDVDDLVRGGAPSRTTQVLLADAELYHGDPVTVNVTGAPAADPSRTFAYEYTVHPIVYAPDADTRIVYAAGAVFRQEPDGTAVLRRPTRLVSRDGTNVVVVATRPGDGPAGVGGDAPALVRTRRAETGLYRANATAQDVTVTVTSPRASGWYRALDAHPSTTCAPPSGSAVSCSIAPDRFHLVVVRVDVSFS